jgi:hypothetical protein
MARTWDKLAEARRRQLEKDGKAEEYDTEGTGDRSQAS